MNLLFLVYAGRVRKRRRRKETSQFPSSAPCDCRRRTQAQVPPPPPPPLPPLLSSGGKPWANSSSSSSEGRYRKGRTKASLLYHGHCRREKSILTAAAAEAEAAEAGVGGCWLAAILLSWAFVTRQLMWAAEGETCLPPHTLMYTVQYMRIGFSCICTQRGMVRGLELEGEAKSRIQLLCVARVL